MGLRSTTRNIHHASSVTTVSDSRREGTWRMLNRSTCPDGCPYCLVYHQQLSGDHGAVVVVGNDTFPRSTESITPPRVQDHEYYSIIGCSHGLFSLFLIGLPSVANGETYATVLGFGVCRETNNPKIVKITHIVSWGDMKSASCIPWQVGVFILSTWAWRRLGGNLLRKLVSFQFDLPDGFC
ncbi:hypothetical protein Hanom_Chr07g00671921 [Helianthus anomalus]